MKKYLALLILVPSLATAAEWPFKSAPYVFIGADYEVSKNSRKVCYSGSDASNLGLGQTLHQKGLVEINAQWTHHSCITEYHDANVYDGFGIHAKINFW